MSGAHPTFIDVRRTFSSIGTPDLQTDAFTV